MPDPDECEEQTYCTPIVDGDNLNEVTVRMLCHGTRVVEFSISHWTHVGGERYEVVRVDSCHYEVHAHQFYRSGSAPSRRVLEPVIQAEDVDASYEPAMEIVFDQWEDNLRRWNRGR